MKRVLTALVLIPIVLGFIYWAPPFALGLVTLLLGVLCFLEYRRLIGAQGLHASLPLGLLAGAALVLVPSFDSTYLFLIAAGAMIAAMAGGSPSAVAPAGAALVLGVLYCFAPYRCAILLRQIDAHWLTFAVAINWVADSAAFAVGKQFGRRKLAPVISPGKTWEGAVASLVASLVFAAIFSRWIQPPPPMAEMLLLASVANVAGQAGDLCESAFKRAAGTKDSGSILPGHGGWLDRLDSTLFTLPVVYLWVSRRFC